MSGQKTGHAGERQANRKKADKVPITDLPASEYTPPCPFCPRVFETEKALQTHIGVVHGKQFVRYQGPPIVSKQKKIIHDVRKVVRNLGGKIQVFPKDAQRAWRQTRPGRMTFGNWEPTKRKPPDVNKRHDLLLPLCVWLAKAEDLNEALDSLPKRLRVRAESVRDRIPGVLNLSRFKRLKGIEARASFLAKALANPAVAPSYSEQKFGATADKPVKAARTIPRKDRPSARVTGKAKSHGDASHVTPLQRQAARMLGMYSDLEDPTPEEESAVPPAGVTTVQVARSARLRRNSAPGPFLRSIR